MKKLHISPQRRPKTRRKWFVFALRALAPLWFKRLIHTFCGIDFGLIFRRFSAYQSQTEAKNPCNLLVRKGLLRNHPHCQLTYLVSAAYFNSASPEVGFVWLRSSNFIMESILYDRAHPGRGPFFLATHSLDDTELIDSIAQNRQKRNFDIS